jgi:hypothetical protein
MAYASNVYTKAEINDNDIIFAAALNNKADKLTTYTKEEINNLNMDSSNKLNNNTGAVSTSIKNNSNEDVAIFIIQKTLY